jgi:hypothetical protein
MQTRTERPPFYWLNEESRRFLSRDYLLPGVSPEWRIRQIADHAETILGIEGFGDKFYDYMARGWYSAGDARVDELRLASGAAHLLLRQLHRGRFGVHPVHGV